jgi:DNA-3-methyladenine glycosylase I
MMDDHRNRCTWAGTEASLMRDYHDREWGVPLHDDRDLFEFLCLEGAQAGLSWRTVLDKRVAYRKAFANFDIAHCARLTDARIDELMTDAGIIRNRRKIVAVRDNACAALRMIEECGSLDARLWAFVDGKPIRNHWRNSSEVPAMSAISECMSAELRWRGFHFVGPTVCYAFMQAVGMINDHTMGCFRYHELAN